MKEQLTKEQAIALSESKVWETWSMEQIVRFQLFQNRLCMPFSKFHEAVEAVLCRPVYTHEFVGDGIMLEYLGEKEVPTFEEICDLIPTEKRIVIQIHD